MRWNINLQGKWTDALFHTADEAFSVGVIIVLGVIYWISVAIHLTETTHKHTSLFPVDLRTV